MSLTLLNWKFCVIRIQCSDVVRNGGKETNNFLEVTLGESNLVLSCDMLDICML